MRPTARPSLLVWFDSSPRDFELQTLGRVMHDPSDVELCSRLGGRRSRCGKHSAAESETRRGDRAGRRGQPRVALAEESIKHAETQRREARAAFLPDVEARSTIGARPSI